MNRNHNDSSSSDPAGAESSNVVSMWQVSDLKPHPLSVRIYGEECDAGLAESILESGIQAPLIVTPDGHVISGNQRLSGAKLAGLPEVPAIVKSGLTAKDIEKLVLDTNVGRKKTTEQCLREYREFKRLEAPSAQARKGRQKEKRTNSSGGPNGRARDIAAEKVGIGTTAAELGLKVLDAIGKHEHLQPVEATRLLHQLNDQSINAAHLAAQALGWVSRPKPAGSSRKAAGKSRADSGSENPTAPTECSEWTEPPVAESEGRDGETSIRPGEGSGSDPAGPDADSRQGVAFTVGAGEPAVSEEKVQVVDAAGREAVLQNEGPLPPTLPDSPSGQITLEVFRQAVAQMGAANDSSKPTTLRLDSASVEFARSLAEQFAHRVNRRLAEAGMSKRAVEHAANIIIQAVGASFATS
jgi:hypothetical protein